MNTQTIVSFWFWFLIQKVKKKKLQSFSFSSSLHYCTTDARLCIHKKTTGWLFTSKPLTTCLILFFCAAAGELHTGQHEAGHGPNPTDRCSQPHGYDDRNRNKPTESNCRANKETDQCGGTGEAALPGTSNIQKEALPKSTHMLCNRSLGKSKLSKQFTPV